MDLDPELSYPGIDRPSGSRAELSYLVLQNASAAPNRLLYRVDLQQHTFTHCSSLGGVCTITLNNHTLSRFSGLDRMNSWWIDRELPTLAILKRA